MSYTAEQLTKIAENYSQLAEKALIVEAKKKEKKKLDPKAKVRNRGTVCVPAESAKDKKDHFPINDEDQARNALARVHQYSSKPEWYSGSLKGLQALVSRKVHSKYPGIGKSEKKKKSSLEDFEQQFAKYAQQKPGDPGFVGPVNQTPQPGDPGFVGPVNQTPQDRYQKLQQTYQQTQQKAAPQSAGKPAADPWVWSLQNFLLSKSLLTGSIGGKYQLDGIMGPNTQAALKVWQGQQGLPSTGKLDQPTIQALNPLISQYRQWRPAKSPEIERKFPTASKVEALINRYAQQSSTYKVGRVLTQTPPGITTQSKSGFRPGDLGTDSQGNTFQATMQNGKLVWTVTAVAK